MEPQKETSVKKPYHTPDLKPYHAPSLTVYGDIRDVTRSNAAGVADGMGGAGMSLT